MKSELTFPLTLEMDISTTTNSSQVIFIDSKSKVAFGYHSGYFICTADANHATTYTIPNDFFDGDIKHVIVTYDSIEDYSVFVNGEKSSKLTYTNYWSTTGNKCYLGKRETYDSYFIGTIYNFCIYNSVLPEEKIRENSN